MKKTLVLLMTILLLCLTAGAVADTEVELKPGPDDLTVEELHARAAAFFSVKCGISFDILQKAPMDIRLLQHQSMRKEYIRSRCSPHMAGLGEFFSWPSW